jgi:zinc protease
MSELPKIARFSLRTALLAAAAILAIPAAVSAQDAAPLNLEPAPLADIAKKVQIPHQSFVLDNGLRVFVHTDRKAPVVAVSVWYDVGSKHEPKGKTGFAHLFEHLMFNGSENAPGDYFGPLQAVGATDFNGTTNADRTNYFQTVPTGALERALFMESDRMGYLLGAVTQEKLDNQRGVVQNEKRQGDNNPLGLLRYEIFENLYPKGSPYHHSTIGSMDDLNAASLDDVKKWFRDNYGPNNAVLVLAGDIDLKTAKPLVEKWFGAIPRGPKSPRKEVPIPTLPAPLAKTIKDKIPTTTIFRMWAVGGRDHPDSVETQMAISVLGGLSSSRLDNSLVRKEQLANTVSASMWDLAQGGVVIVSAAVKPGADIAVLNKRLDEEIAAFIASGPTKEELQRVATGAFSETIAGFEAVGGFGGKAVALAEGALYANDSNDYRKQLDEVAAATPDAVKKVAATWLSRPAFSLTVEPGERTEGGENRGGAITGDTPITADMLTAQNYRQIIPGQLLGGSGDTSDFIKSMKKTDAAKPTATPVQADRSKLPDVGQLAGLDFPALERGKLKNGIEVVFAKRNAAPLVQVMVSFDAGTAADPANARGTQSLMLSMMGEGTKNLNSEAFAIAGERLGASISGSAGADETQFYLSTLSANMAPSLRLLADYVRNPAFDEKELVRVRARQLSGIDGELNNPRAVGGRVMSETLYGKAHPYGGPGSGYKSVVEKLTRDDLMRFHSSWVRPEKARIYVVGDTSLKAVMAELNATFGNWSAGSTPLPTKNFSIAMPAAKPRILLVDRPGAPQSVIIASSILQGKGTDDAKELTKLSAANEVFGGSFLSRINMNLRETKGWSYGVGSGISMPNEAIRFSINAPVQSDRTGDSIKELQRELKEYVTTKGVTPAELELTQNDNIRSLPGQYETSGAVLGGVADIVARKRPDDYYEKVADTYRAMTPADLDSKFRKMVDPAQLTWVVVGDAAKVKPQLDGLGLAVETVVPEGMAAPAAPPPAKK